MAQSRRLADGCAGTSSAICNATKSNARCRSSTAFIRWPACVCWRRWNKAQRQERAVDVLLEVNASREANKQGFAPEEVIKLTPALAELKYVRVDGPDDDGGV